MKESNMRRAQSSLEVLVVFSILMVIFATVVEQFYMKVEDTQLRDEREELSQLCNDIARAIMVAKVTGNGYHEYIEFRTANLSFFPDVRTLDINQKEVCFLPTTDITIMSVGEERIDIYNVNGSVIIS
jgi:hypothetical protein